MIRLHDAFISYGRADSKEFAKKLHDRLAKEALKVWFDFNDIPLGVDYQNQIDEGIEKADNFLFIIAPHSVNSPYCGKEVELALKLNKRIIPLLHVEQINREIWQQRFPSQGDNEWKEYTAKGKHSSFPNMHPEIAKINWVYCREGIDDFEQAFQGLQALLRRQQLYVRQHTLFLSKTLEWERQQKQSRYLLVGEERQQAEAWLKVRFKEEQPPCIPTDLHCEFITESRKNSQNLMTEVFLSYAEEEIAVMEQVRRSLRTEGFTVWTNKTDIQTGADFQAAIKSGVEEADNIVYLLSPAALRSPYCQQEIDYAISLNKRIIPLLVQPTDLEQVPPALRGLQYIDLTDNTDEIDYQQDESQLLRTLRQDAAYYEESKVLLTKALKWERQHRNPSILLRGYNLQHAETWLKVAQSRSHHKPLPIQTEFIAASLQQPPGISLDVFVSYSRTDSDFARRLNDALQVQGKTTWFDQESIASGADFQREIYRGIENSNNFLFVISPNSISSPYCNDEVEYAQKLNKRIVTVLHRPVNVPDLHPVLAAVQWIDFGQQEKDFTTNFKEVLRTIDIDPVHLQSHTRLLVRAIEWDSKGRKESLLLRGDDLDDAEQWIAQADKRDPKPTSLQQDYVNSSRSVEAANRQASQILEAAAKKGKQRVLVGTTVMAIGLVVAGIATAYAYKAETDRKVANTKVQLADQHEKEAKQQAQLATQQGQAATKQAQLATQQEQAATKQAQLATQQEQAAKQQMMIAQAQVSKAEEREKQAQVGLNQAEIATKNAQKKREAAEQELKTATVKTAEAEQKLQTANQNVVLAQQKLNAAEIAQKEARAGTTLERQGADALKQFEFEQLDALVAAVRAGKELKALVKDGRSLDKYPSINPLLALNTILAEIKELSQIESDNQPLEDASFSPDGNYLITAVDNTAQIRDSSGKLIAELKGHQGAIRSANFSPDGNLIVTGSHDNTARIWQRSGKLMAELIGHEGAITSTSFSPDGNLIVTGSSDKTARIWQRSGKLIAELKGHKGAVIQASFIEAVIQASFSPDSKFIVTASRNDPIARLWNSSGQMLAELKGDQYGLTSVGFSPDGQLILTASEGGFLRLWNLSGQIQGEIKAHQHYVLSASFSPDGKYIVTASNDNTARVWDKSGGQPVVLMGHQGVVTQANFSPDGKYITTASFDGTARIWDTWGNLIAILKGHEDRVNSANFSPNGQRLITKSEDNTVRVWALSEPPMQEANWSAILSEYEKRSSTNRISVASFSPDGKHLIATAARYNDPAHIFAQIFNLSGQSIAQLQGTTDDFRVEQANFSRDGQRIVTVSKNRAIRIWDLTGKLLTQFSETHPAPISSVAFSPDGDLIVTASADKTARIWDRSGKLLVELKGHGDSVKDAQFSPDGKFLVTASADKTARIWDRSGKLLTELKADQGAVNSASFSPDGKLIVTGSDDKTARIWDRSGKLLVELKGHKEPITHVSFSPDGQRIVTTSRDVGSWKVEATRIWDVSGRLIAEFKGGKGTGSAIAQFSPNSQRLLMASTDGTIQVWRTDLDGLLTQGCRWLGQYLQEAPDLSKDDRRLCDDVTATAQKQN